MAGVGVFWYGVCVCRQVSEEFLRTRRTNDIVLGHQQGIPSLAARRMLAEGKGAQWEVRPS